MRTAAGRLAPLFFAACLAGCDTLQDLAARGIITTEAGERQARQAAEKAADAAEKTRKAGMRVVGVAKATLPAAGGVMVVDESNEGGVGLAGVQYEAGGVPTVEFEVKCVVGGACR